MATLSPPSITASDKQLASISVGALSFLIWELCITFDDEVDFIWSKSCKSPIKWMFLLLRYIGLGSLAGNHLISIDTNSSPLGCKGFLALQMALCQALVAIVEIILVLRGRSTCHSISKTLIDPIQFMHLVGSIITVVGLILSMREIQFDHACAVTHAGSPASSSMFAFVVVEGILLLLTAIKCIYTFRTTGQWVTVVTLMLRDSTLLFLAIASLLIPTLVLLVVSHGALTSALYPWFNGLLSCASMTYAPRAAD
ncbi:hypothetical protein BV22DRAFT_1124771 [Leucogyrophana mollusca]|uniref:Uncharacterized protein n=1 Tax=Leucogyrophana mollusca TaxID=85980 RepID=A0ACB8BZM0_9AGAM|nr:hypothetical protein BV22DRAFT_1124771 [Leucogyrophana mollusca]